MTDFERPEIIRPPSEWDSYYLPLTGGCSNNTCTFCNYWGSKLRLRDVADIKKEIDALAAFTSRGVILPGISRYVYAIGQQWDGKKIFLQDGDALVYPFAKLKEVLQYINDTFPALERIATYATPRDLLRLTTGQLAELKELKLTIVYMGVESGDDNVLLKIHKGVNAAEIIEAGRKVKTAGIKLSVTVILGLGGIEGSKEHAEQTADGLSKIDPDYCGALTLTLVPGTPLYKQCENGDFHPIPPFQSLKELRVIIEKSVFSHCFFSSMHASNYLSVRGTLPEAKKTMLEQIDRVLASRDESLLRPEFLRGL
jgi:radical SAM superfamily enzyme YgiQ (UPF0313 family)